MLWHRDVQMLSWCLQNWGPGGRWEERVLAPDRLLGKSPPFPPREGDRAWVEVPASEHPRELQAGGAASLHVSGWSWVLPGRHTATGYTATSSGQPCSGAEK